MQKPNRLTPARLQKPTGDTRPFHGFHKGNLPDPLVGRLLDCGYTLERRIGSGGTSSVYAASDGGGTDEIAVKVASQRLAPGLANRVIENESSILEDLSHGNVIRYLGKGSLDGRSFLMTEYLEGRTLFESTDTGRRMSWERARGILIQLCDALEYIHGQGLVHRDVKTGNILIKPTPDGDMVKLLDFGIARPPNAPDVVPSNMAAGTVTYMAPEIIMQERYDHRSDIYSVGIMMYKMLCGMAPFTGSAKEILLKHVAEEPIRPREVHPYLNIPHEMDSIVMQALAKEPAMRFADAAAMREAIARCTFWPKETGLMDGMDWARVMRLADDF